MATPIDDSDNDEPLDGDEARRRRRKYTKPQHFDSAYYSELGKKGGKAMRATRDAAYYAAIGEKGGRTLAAQRGPEYYSEIGKKGGEAVKSKHDAEYYARIGRKGGQTSRRGEGRVDKPA